MNIFSRLGIREVLIVGALMLSTLSPAAEVRDPPLKASELMPLEHRVRTFTIIQGTNSGEDVPHILRQAPDGDGWTLALEGYNQLHLRQSDEGALLLTALEIEDLGRRIVFENPVPLLPATIQPDKTYDASSPVKVIDLESGKTLYTGTAQHHMNFVRRATFDLPQGDMTGYLVEITESIDLPAADIQVELETGFVPQQGPVYRDLKYTVEKLGFFDETTMRTVVLAEALKNR